LSSATDVLNVLPSVSAWQERVYKDLHAHPELSFHETRTAALAAAKLKELGYEVVEQIGRTGVVGVLRNGMGQTVLARADMDALPVQERTGLPYASTLTTTDDTGASVPVMHACGHDAHVTCLLGAAELLATARRSRMVFASGFLSRTSRSRSMCWPTQPGPSEPRSARYCPQGIVSVSPCMGRGPTARCLTIAWTPLCWPR
jgi:hypothetical protein